MNQINTLFIGTSDFAVPVLEKLSDLDFINLLGVVTQPDKSVGRHQSDLQPSPVKKWATENLPNVKIFQPEKLRNDAETILKQAQPELIVVASYGQMIPKVMIDYPKFKCLNVHVSLLADLRGAVPMPMAILKGSKKTGVSIPIMTEKLDDGDLIGQREIEINDDETTESLTIKASKAGAELISEVLPKWFAGEITPVPQDESKATYCQQTDISKDKAELKSSDSAIEIDRKVRAFYPWPITWAYLRSPGDNKQGEGIEADKKFAGKRLKIFKVKVLDSNSQNNGNLKLFKHKSGLILRANIGWLEILECQLEGKQKMSGKDSLFLAVENLPVTVSL